MRRLLIAVLWVAGGGALWGQSPAPDPTLQQSLMGATDFVYKRASGVELRLWVFSPADLQPTQTRPALLLFSGGGWTNQNPQQFSPQARYFASRGMVAILAEYRVRGVNNTTPYDAVADAKSAVRWVREHARELHVAPNALAVGGGSAGGHLALAAAVVSAFDEPTEDLAVSSRPNALVLFNPVTNTVLADSVVARSPQLQPFVGLLGPRAQEISPLHHLARDLPPTIILHGTADRVAPFAEAAAFCRQAADLGNHCELVGFDGAEHGFFNPTRSTRWYHETLTEAERFLRALGYLR